MMDLAPVAAISTAAAALLGRLLPGHSVGGRRRDLILRDIELYERLPNDSPARQVLLQHIERSVTKLTVDEEVQRRNPFGMTLAALFLVGGLLLANVGRNAQSWQWTWWVAAVVCLVFGAVGMAQDAASVERDERGRPVRGPRS